MNPESWHQQQGILRRYRLRNEPAHIKSDNWVFTGLMLCGEKNASVTVRREHAHNQVNRTCKECLKKLGDD